MIKQPKKLQWHPAFYAGLQIVLADEQNKLVMKNEHHLGSKPKQIDVLILKKDSSEQVKKDIGRIFKTHNIFEYKSPDDSLSIDDFYRVYGYTCFYKSDTVTENEIDAKELTISFVCSKKPLKLLKYLIAERGYSIIPAEEGIYYIQGDFFPMQLLVTTELSEEENFWLKNLTNDLTDKRDVDKLLSAYEEHKDNKLYQSVMDVIVRANKELFMEEGHMCQAILELDFVQKAITQGEARGIHSQLLSQIQCKLAKGKSPEVIADEVEESVERVMKLIEELNNQNLAT